MDLSTRHLRLPPFFTTSVEPTYKTKDGLSKITCAVLPTTSVGAVRLSVPVTGNDSSSAISQESNLNNHIRVLSASKKGFSSSANSAAFTCSASELTKPGTVAPLITGDLGVWTSFVRSSPPLPSNPSAVPDRAPSPATDLRRPHAHASLPWF